MKTINNILEKLEDILSESKEDKTLPPITDKPQPPEGRLIKEGEIYWGELCPKHQKQSQ